ncbi:MAG: tetratricopeptide repeat protein [Candidatus Obscuribacterales bacterium]|nr:tetratricopeptide repeat protein [Candidatus Obscuribacterales bacterium]
MAQTDNEIIVKTAHDLFNAGDYEAAAAALKLALSKTDGNNREFTICLQNLALLEYMDFHTETAEQLYLKALPITESCYGKDSMAVANNLYGLSRCLRRDHKFEDAQMYLERILDIRTKNLGNGHRLVGNTLLDLAVNCDRLGRTVNAQQMFEKTIEQKERIYGKDSPYLIKTLDTYSKFLHKINDQSANTVTSRLEILKANGAVDISKQSKIEDGSGWLSIQQKAAGQ